jgi:iron complex transport system permease protein
VAAPAVPTVARLAAERAFRLPPAAVVAAIGALVGAVVVGAAVGPAGLPLPGIALELVDALPLLSVDSGLSDRQATILWQWRLPRVVLGGLVGGALAVSGAAYQGVFRNPLADPYLLGVAAGAGLGATIVIAYGPSSSLGPVDVLPLAAFVGALGGVSVAYALGRGTARSPAALILAGVAVASFLTAVQTYVMQQNVDTLREVYSWILGRLSTSGWGDVALLGPYVVVCSAVIWAHRRQLDVLRLGDEEARAVGADPARVRLVVVVAASLATAAAVAVSGLIAFVGIIVPHLVRLLVGSSYRVVLPLSFVVGAAFLISADVVARTVVAPGELPIGVVTAFVGAPFFGLVLWTSRRSLP